MSDFIDKLSDLTNEQIDTFRRVNVLDYVVGKLESGEIQACEVEKFARITARQGKDGEEVVTMMQNGLEETRNVVSLDEKTGEPGWIVTNPGGEQYIVSDSVFKKKYEIDPENPEQYKPKGGPVLSVKVEEDIEFAAPWGEMMRIEAGGSLIVNGRNDIYGIQAKEFEDTYKSTGKAPREVVDELKKTIEYEKIVEGKSKN